MGKTKVLLQGATGETGASILEGLVQDGSFDISITVRPSSAQKPAVLALGERGFPILPIDLTSSISPDLLSSFSIVISCIGPEAIQSQLNLATAASLAGVQRFVPCAFITICPPGGIMRIRDDKEEVYNHMFRLKLPYTIIDTGFWHQLSFPRLPSGKVDSVAIAPMDTVYGDGEAKNLLTDLRDIGNWVARIIRDPRTLNKKVVIWSDELSQKEVNTTVEKVSGEKLETTSMSEEQLERVIAKAKRAWDKDPTNVFVQMGVWSQEYNISKYFREDNTRKNALYLGYLDGRELYPDFSPITFEKFFKEILGGEGRRLYPEKWGK